MTDTVKSLAQLKKADKLVRLTMRRNGPRSYNRGLGALLRCFEDCDTLTRNELIEKTDWSRHNLKNVVKKGQKKGFFTMVETDEPHTYSVTVTELGKEVLAKRLDAQKEAAGNLFACLTDEELAQLDAITEKLIIAAKADGKVCARNKGYRIHKGHKGHVSHAECK